MDLLQAIVLAVVEGVTEYLPISSTGHLIIVSAVMGLNEDNFVKSFNIIIQFGAILSVLVLYWKRLQAPLSFYLKILIGFLPAAILGLLIKNKIDAILGSVAVVGWSLFLGGIFLLWIDRQNLKGKKTISSLSYREAFLIGTCQCLAFIPGVSRSAASIVAGLFFGLQKKEAAEFSFFLAVPTLTGATLIKGLKVLPTVQPEQIHLLLVGIVVAFFVACLAIKTFIEIVSHKGFWMFGIYRILLAACIFLMI